MAAAAIIGVLVVAASAEASQTVSAASSVARPCHRDVASSRTGRDLVRTTARSRSIVSARLRSHGDWDIAIFGDGGRLVAGSASFGGNELAEGFVRKGERLTIQSCRFRGDAGSARVSIHFTRLEKRPRGALQVVDVVTGTRADKELLQTLGLDLTEHGDAKSLEVVLHGRADARRLKRAGFRYTVRIADLAAHTRRNQRLDARHARARSASRLPSRRDSYRRLPDYDLEMKQLAMRLPVAGAADHAEPQERARS